jgi:AcrR family transcriptional regulator
VRSENGSADQRELTFIEAARRAQIVTAAIDTIAELGYGQASLARIARRARTSKGVISYHFAGKDDLIREVVADVLAKAEAFMVPKILAAGSSGAGMLRAYIQSNVSFMLEHPNHLLAVRDVFLNARAEDGSMLFGEKTLDHVVTSLRVMLAHFQSVGEFRPDFDPQVMAVAIRGAIDAVPNRMVFDPRLDIDRYGREMATLFDLATRGEPPGRAEAGR